MMVQAILAQDEQSFWERLDFIAAYKPLFNNLKKDIEEAKKKVQSSKDQPLDEKSEKLLEVLAFFDGIELYLVPTQHIDLFDDIISQEDINKIYPFISSKKLKDTKLTHLLNKPYAFDKQNLKNYLNNLANVFDDTNTSLPMIVRNVNHSICLKYHKKNRTWLCVDINVLGLENNSYFHNLTIEELADSIFTSFVPEKYPHVVINMEILTNKENPTLQSALEDLHAQHPITFKQAKIHDHLDTGLLFLACRHDHLDVIKDLLKQPTVSVNTKTLRGETPLLIACAKGHLEVVQELLKHPEIAVNESNLKKQTPLSFACAKKYTLVVQALLEHKLIDVNQVVGDQNKKSPLYIACEYGYYDIVQKLVEREDILVDQGNSGDITPLCAASYLGLVDIVWALLPKSNINQPSNAGNGPLHYACALPSSEVNQHIIHLLLEHGASLTAKNNNEETAIDVALASENSVAIYMLLEFTLDNGLDPDQVMSPDTFEDLEPWIAENLPVFINYMREVKQQSRASEISFFNHIAVDSEPSDTIYDYNPLKKI
ncbi:ankyrin repeat domain-containing protein [Legionella rowbothamii]|uniref:ankyrin repeat domain-containing protein n=1 Tax=Legionella rowbothamii TaxID=96229 RepID=UPI0013EF6628|nr:ankyrin repeat domain-containing protein [Legionella rowbothamii]